MAAGDYCDTDGCLNRVPAYRGGRYCRNCSSKRCKAESADAKARRIAHARVWQQTNNDRHRVHSNRHYWKMKLMAQGWDEDLARAEAALRYPMVGA